jgi:hypothetical protein
LRWSRINGQAQLTAPSGAKQARKRSAPSKRSMSWSRTTRRCNSPTVTGRSSRTTGKANACADASSKTRTHSAHVGPVWRVRTSSNATGNGPGEHDETVLQRLLQTPLRSKNASALLQRASAPNNAASGMLRPRTEATKQPYRGASVLRLRGCLLLTSTFHPSPSNRSVLHDRR